MPSLFENLLIAPFHAPADISGGSPTERYINAKLSPHWLIVVGVKASAGTDTAAITISQATDSSGTGDKAVSFTTYYAMASVSASTYALSAATASSNTITTAATTNEQIYVIPVNVDSMLDIANSFDWFKINITDPGNNATYAWSLALGGPQARFSELSTANVNPLA